MVEQTTHDDQGPNKGQAQVETTSKIEGDIRLPFEYLDISQTFKASWFELFG